MKAITNPNKTNIEITSGQSCVKFNTREQTTEVMGLKTNVKGPSVEWEWSTKEDKANKVQTIDENSTEVQYPSAKCVYEAIQNIPGTEQVQSDWNQSDTEAVDYIKNKPVIPVVPTNVSSFTNDAGYITLSDVPAQAQSDWNQSDNQAVDYIKNKPTIPASPVQSNWNESNSSSLAYIQNKPTIPAAPVNADWNSSSGLSEILNKPTIPVVAQSITSGDTGYTTGDMVYQYIQSLPSGGGSETHDVELTISVTAGQTITFRGAATTVSWGDGTSDLSPATSGSTHTYTDAGSYIVTIDGITSWGDASQSSLVDRSILGANVITSAVVNTTEIGAQAFRENAVLTSIRAPFVNKIGIRAFNNCTGLVGDINSFIHTGNLTEIGDYCFQGCDGLTGCFDMTLLKQTTSSDWFNGGYQFPKNITSVIFPNSPVTNPLRFSSEIKSIVIPDGVRVLRMLEHDGNGNGPYYVRIPGSVQTIDHTFLSNLRNLTELYIEDGAFSAFNDWNPANNTENYGLYKGSTTTSSKLCYECTNLKKVRLPEGMKVLGDSSGTATYMDSNFYESKIEQINLPSSLTKIYNSFQYCTMLTSVTIPASVTGIYSGSFSYCTALTEIHMLGATPPTLKSNCFQNCSALTAVYVPTGSLTDYQNHADWTRFSSILVEE